MDHSQPHEITDLERGILVGLLVGEGHFGGDGKQPQITLRMHTRHEAIFRWLQRLLPRGRLYGPYHHGGRSYYQWMARGEALAEDVLPLVEGVLTEEIDAHVSARIREMRARYTDFFARYERNSDGLLTDLVRKHALPAAARPQLRTILETIAADERAPTAVRDPEQAARAHFADSLAALEIDQIRDAGCVADLGAGAGFPGLPLAVALPRTEVRLVESQAKKCAFLRHLIAAAGIDNAHVIESRIEEWSDGIGVHEAVLARALAPQSVVLEYAAPLLRQGGLLVDWRGRRDGADEQAALEAAAELGMERIEVREVRPFAAARDLHIHVYAKSSQTPPRFPRRSGMARKRPLGRPAPRRDSGQGAARHPSGADSPADRGPQ